MTKKFSAARRGAFLKALAETGNYGLAAERAKVSRSWVGLHRRGDPGFDAACWEAVAAAKAALCGESLDPVGGSLDYARDERVGKGRDERVGGGSSAWAPDRVRGARGLKPPSGWGTLDGVQLVVRGTGGAGGGKRVQIARSRLKQWDPATEDRFLQVLAATCNVKAACAAVEMSAPGAYAHRERWPAFKARWEAAVEEGYRRLEVGLLESAANLFSGREQPDAAAVGPMRVDEAIQLLALHQYQARNVGKPAGRQRRRRTLDEVRGSILRKLEAIDVMDEVGPDARARDEEEWARRRGGADRSRPSDAGD